MGSPSSGLFLTVDQAARKAGVPRETILEWVRTRRLLGVETAPGDVSIPRQAFDAVLGGKRRSAPDELRRRGSSRSPLRRYEEHFGLSTADMLARHGRGEELPVRDADDERLYDQWRATAELVQRYGSLAASGSTAPGE